MRAISLTVPKCVRVNQAKSFSMWFGIYTLLSSFALQENASGSVAAPPVKLTVFYEILCPDSIIFFQSQLMPLYNSLSNITDIDIYAYGKVDERYDPMKGSYEFRCQHGPEECYGNTVLECAKRYVPSYDAYLKFVFCVMTSHHPHKAGRKCSHYVGIPYLPIMRCSSSEEGVQLFHEAGQIQKKLAPNLYQVPWIMVDGKYSEKGQEEALSNLVRLVCESYKGRLPPICFSSQVF